MAAAANGTQTAALWAGALAPARVSTQIYDGSAISVAADLGTARYSVNNGGGGTSVAAIVAGGYTGTASTAATEEFTELVEAIRMTEVALGDPFKECQDEERQMAQVSRKSIVLKQDIQEGEVLTQDHITMKRPGTGLLAHFIPSVLNKIVNKSLKQNHLLQWNDLQ